MPRAYGIATSPDTRILTGTYTGDGTRDQDITGLGFQPDYVRIALYSELLIDDVEEQKWDGDPVGMSHYFHAVTWHKVGATTRLISIDADGFSVDDGGNDSDPNKLNRVYVFFALRNT